MPLASVVLRAALSVFAIAATACGAPGSSTSVVRTDTVEGPARLSVAPVRTQLREVRLPHRLETRWSGVLDPMSRESLDDLALTLVAHSVRRVVLEVSAALHPGCSLPPRELVEARESLEDPDLPIALTAERRAALASFASAVAEHLAREANIPVDVEWSPRLQTGDEELPFLQGRLELRALVAAGDGPSQPR